MTANERADVWQRKLALQDRLAKTTGKKQRTALLARIEACNTELITDKFKPSPEGEESQVEV